MTAAALPDRHGGMVGLAVLLLLAAIPLQRFGFTLLGAELSFVLPLTLVAVGWLALAGRLDADPVRFATFGLVVAAAAVSVLANAHSASATSLALLIATYAPFVMVMETDRGTWLRVLAVFQALALGVAGLGVVQFLAQFAIDAPWLFGFEGVLPDAVLLGGYNTVVPITYGASVLKANGGVLLEPSILSQIAALALLIELLMFGRWLYLVGLAAALPVAYSGTGLLLLAAFLLPVLMHRRAYGAALGGAAAVAVALALGDVWNADALLSRIGEFSSDQTSAFARFLSAFRLLQDHVLDDPVAVLFGLGPGSITRAVEAAPYVAHDPTWGKLLFEYGVVGTLALAVFLGVCLFAATPSAWISAFLLFGYLFFGGMLLDPRYAALMLLLVVLPRTDEN